MGRIDWIKDLVVAEQRMEEQGIVELDGLNNQSEMLKTETIDFLRDLRAAFIESCSAFNELNVDRQQRAVDYVTQLLELQLLR